MILSKYVVCGTKKSIFLKTQKVKGLLTSLGLKTGVDKTHFFGNYLL